MPENATVVFVMNHRSNMDYVLASHLAADQAALSYAVGEWARVWPLSALIRSMGAYFVRRNSKDDLYRRVLECYIAMATQAGVPQAVFPEGGLTRNGLLGAPRLGVIDYMLRGFRLDGERDLVFVPLGLNYDRVLEDRTLLRSIDPNARPTNRFWTVWNTLGFVVNNLRLMGKSGWRRFGYACVNFGTPVSMRAYCVGQGIDFQTLGAVERKRAIGELGEHLMAAVGRVVPVLPVPLVAAVILAHEQTGISELELKAEVNALIDGSRPSARTPTSRARISTMPSASACACSPCAIWSGKPKGCTRRSRSSCRCCATTPTRSPTSCRKRPRKLPDAGRGVRRGGATKNGGAGQGCRGLLSKPPQLPAPPRPQVGAASARATPCLHQARDSVGHWRASAAGAGNQNASGRLLAARTTKAVAARRLAA